MAPVKITMSSNVVKLRHILIQNESCEPEETWEYFLRSQNVKLNPKHYMIVAKNKMKSFLDKKISGILDYYKRKSSMKVFIEEIDNHKFKTKTTEPRGKGRKQVQKKDKTPKHHHDNLQHLTVKQMSPVKLFIHQPTTPTLLNHEPVVCAGLKVFDCPPMNIDTNDDDEGLSQLSQDEDDVEPNNSSSIKDHIKASVERLPKSHISLMQNELKELRSGGEGRDYKWAHYCPRTSAWIFSVFKV